MTISLAAHEIFPLVHHFALMPGMRLEWAPARILAITGKGHVRTIIVDGDAGQPVQLYFTTDAPATVIKGNQSLVVRGPLVSLRAFCPEVLQAPLIYSFRVGADTVRILVMNRGLADRTWLPEVDGQSYIVCGPAYMGDMKVKGGHISILTERKANAGADGPMWAYRASGKEVLLRPSPGIGLGTGAEPGAESMKEEGTAEA
jgi:beta-galactosidase